MFSEGSYTLALAARQLGAALPRPGGVAPRQRRDELVTSSQSGRLLHLANQ